METTILALDPGVTTGCTIAELSDEGHIKVRYNQYEWSVSQLCTFINNVNPDYLICEDFEYRPGKAKPNLVLYPVQLIGICHLWDQLVGAKVLKGVVSRRLFIQKAATGKAHFTDAKLKELELYVEGLDHGRDSCRHFLHWLNFGWGYQLIERTGVTYEWVG